METYLTEIKQLRIPRPKFEPNSCHQQHQHAVTAAAAAAAAAVAAATATTTPTPPHHQWRHFVRPFTPPRDYHLPMAVQGAGGGCGSGGGAGAWSDDSSSHDKM